MNQNDERFQYLLSRYLQRSCTAAEKRELMGMIADGHNDSDLKEQIMHSLANSEATETISEQEAQKILGKILGKTETATRGRTLRWPGIMWLAIGAAAAMLVFALPRLFFHGLDEKSLPNEIMHASKLTPKYVRLPDGSTALLTAGSQLLAPKEFVEGRRSVTLIGEAYFDIAPDSERPFYVQSGTVTTKVLGTAFNIRAYPDEEEVVITVDHGKVEVAEAEGTPVVLTANQQVAINAGANKIIQKSVNSDELLAWQKGVIVLDDITLEKAATLLEKQYQIKIVFGNDRIRNCRIRASFFNGESLQEVMFVIANVLNLTWEQSDKNTLIWDGPGC